MHIWQWIEPLNVRRVWISGSLWVVVALTCAAPLRGEIPIPKPPSVDARSYILIDHLSGRVLAEMNADERMEPASLTKLMTAYVAFKALSEKRVKLTDIARVSERAVRAEGSRTYLQSGTEVPLEVLLKGMIVQSGNDATIALAERVAGTESAFVRMMNAYAESLGMLSSHFENSPGLPAPDHYTTARDITRLAQAILREFPQYYPWYSLREFTWNNVTQQNRNGLLTRDPTVDGMKTGHTETAGYCLVSSANRDGMRLIAVVMGSSSIKGREDASAALLNHGYTFFETVKIKSRGDVVLKPRVYLSDVEFVPVGLKSDVYVTVGRGEGPGLRTAARVREPLMAPLPATRIVGELIVTAANGDIVAQAALVPLQTIAEGGVWTRLLDTVVLWFE